MGLHGENYHRLARLFAPHELEPGRYVSSLGDGLDVQLDVLQHHRYTLDLGLTYALVDHETGAPSPAARLRMYHDARLAEVLECQDDPRLEKVLGRLVPARSIFVQRQRMGSFLNRWLEYLAGQGHSVFTLEAAPA